MAPTPRIGTEFAGYRIQGLLGHGGMGVVYRAEHPRTGATIALKVMEPGLALDETFRERFVREARAAARIRHPNIVPVVDAGEWQGDLFIAMVYIEGDDLKTVLRKDGLLTTEQTYEIGRQIASALDSAHQRGLIHRDVKPGNILLEPGPDPASAPLAYLADLGLTKHVDSHGAATESGGLLGTIDYIAPEQISGERIDGRADIYSLACVLFECLTGTVPYVRETQAAVLWAHLHDPIPSPRKANPSLPTSVEEALTRGMAKSPDDRFPTAGDLVSELRAPVDRATVGRNGADRRRTRRSPPFMSAPAAPATERRGGRRRLALAAIVGALAGALAVGAGLFLTEDEIASPRATTTTSPTNETTPAPRLAALTPFDKELLPYVPDRLRASCRHARPLTSDFDATLSCRPGGSVSSLKYSHARSGILLFDYFATGMEKAGLPPMPNYRHPEPTGLCGVGDIPSINTITTVGFRRRTETQQVVTREDRVGFIRCYRHGGRARIEWVTSEPAIYAVATGVSLAALYDWWSTEGGPEP